MTEWLKETVSGGSFALAVPVAVVAGLVSFFSPCVIPLLPGYLSYATGISGADLAEGRARRGRLLTGASLFVLGFSVVFVLLGVASGTVGLWLRDYERTIAIVLGGSRSCSAWPSWDCFRSCNATSASTGCRRSAWPRHRCWASCSRSAGRPASGPA